MSRSKKPAIIVAILLCAFIVVPLIALMVFRAPDAVGKSTSLPANGLGSNIDPGQAVSDSEVGDFDSRQLADQAEALLQGPLADALRKGDLSLSQMAEIQRRFDKARVDLADGKTGRAQEGFTDVITSGTMIIEARQIAEKARSMNASTYSELKRLEGLRATFENSYTDAVERYNQALTELNGGDFKESIEGFKMVEAILGDLEARSIQRVATLLEAADSALAEFRLDEAGDGYESVLKVDSGNVAATEGLVSVSALEGITEQVQAIRSLVQSGALEKALSEIESLIGSHPHNTFLKKERESIQAQLIERDFAQYVAGANRSEADGEYAAAIEFLKKALALRPDAEQSRRLAELEKKYLAARLEVLLEQGFDALKAGQNEAARTVYREAVKLAPNSQEARKGLEKASSLYLAQIRYTQHIEDTKKYIEEGRFPLAGTFFNKAMASRPTNLTASQQTAETKIREELETQSKKVTVTIESDKRTYVSLIGVLPPDRFKETELTLFPDVYKLKGARSGYETVEIEFKVNANNPSPTIEVVASKKQ